MNSHEWSEVPPERYFYRRIIKDFIRDDLPLTHVRVKKMLRDLLKMGELGIYPMDIKLRYYKGGLLVDFSSAITELHFTFQISPEWQNALTRNTDLVEFEEMIEKAQVKTWVRAWAVNYKRKLRPRDPARKRYPK